MKNHFLSCFVGIVIFTGALSVSAAPQKTTSQPTAEQESLAHKLVDQHQLLSLQERLRHLQPSKHSGVVPEGELEAKQAELPGEQTHRRLREEAHKGFYQQPVSDPGFLVKGQPETINLMFIDSVRIDDGSGDSDELPVHESAAIAIGIVKSAKHL